MQTLLYDLSDGHSKRKSNLKKHWLQQSLTGYQFVVMWMGGKKVGLSASNYCIGQW